MDFLPLFASIKETSWLEFLIIGLVAGLLLDACLRGNGYGFLGNTLLGLAGAILGGFIWDKVLAGNIRIDIGTARIQLNMVLVAFLGAILLLLLIKLIGRQRKR